MQVKESRPIPLCKRNDPLVQVRAPPPELCGSRGRDVRQSDPWGRWHRVVTDRKYVYIPTSACLMSRKLVDHHGDASRSRLVRLGDVDDPHSLAPRPTSPFRRLEGDPDGLSQPRRPLTDNSLGRERTRYMSQ